MLFPQFLFDHVETSCSSATECQPLIMEALKWHLLPERRPMLSSERTNPRKSTMCKMLAVGGMDANKVISEYDIIFIFMEEIFRFKGYYQH
jgi:kelch-like protein 1/4/5